MTLTDAKCGRRHRGQGSKPTDGGRRPLWVHPNGARLWRFAYRFGGTRRLFPRRVRARTPSILLADFALAAFVPFFMQSPSFVAHQRHLEIGHGRSNCQTLFGISKIPGESQVRAMLDPIAPALFYSMFADILAGVTTPAMTRSLGRAGLCDAPKLLTAENALPTL